ncbi:MAG TPA: hypothetical protein V6C86_09515 [Oculatellaceae cyanobacterium]
MKRPDPFDIHSLIPVTAPNPSHLIDAVRTSFRETLQRVGTPLSEEEEALLHGLVHVVYAQCTMANVKPRFNRLLAVCAQAAWDEVDHLKRGRLLHLGARLQRVYSCPISVNELPVK